MAEEEVEAVEEAVERGGATGEGEGVEAGSVVVEGSGAFPVGWQEGNAAREDEAAAAAAGDAAVDWDWVVGRDENRRT